MTLNGVMAVRLRYFTEFGRPCFPTQNRVDLWRNLCTCLLYSVLRVGCRRKESLRSLFHLLMSFLSILILAQVGCHCRVVFYSSTRTIPVSNIRV